MDSADVLARLDTIIDLLTSIVGINNSIYAFLAFFVTIVLCGLVIYIMLRPVFYFLR